MCMMIYYVRGHIIQIYSEITCGRILNGQLYAQRLQKLIYLFYLQTV